MKLYEKILKFNDRPDKSKKKWNKYKEGLEKVYTAVGKSRK